MNCDPLGRPIIHQEEWNDWKRGDICGIAGEAGRFIFMWVRVDSDGAPMWVDVVGGPWHGTKETKEWRSFPVDRLTKKIVRRSAK